MINHTHARPLIPVLAEPQKRESTQRKNVQLTLHTALAQRVFKGQTDGPVGIPQFAGLMRRIWEASRLDDPYADLFLLRIYDSIARTRKRFKQWEVEYTQKLQGERGIAAERLFDETPLQIPLKLATPYAFMAVYLVVDLDVLTSTLLTLLQLALLSKKEVYKQTRVIVHQVHVVLSEPLLWRDTGVTRDDIRHGREKALLAQSLMGELDEQIFFEEIELPYSPKFKKTVVSKVVGLYD